MTKDSARLVAYGFLKKGEKPVIKTKDKSYPIEGKTPEQKLESIKKLQKELGESEVNGILEKIADHDEIEPVKDQIILTDYPKALNKYQMSLESWHQSIETYYYWSLNFFGDIGFPVIHKITDIFTAAEHSSFAGVAGQRVGLAQDKASTYLATIGRMVKDLFQLVRELRWIDERLEIYRGAVGVDKEGKKLEKGARVGDEVTLKGMWVDLVDGVVGGQRTGSNLYNMAAQVQFVALPALFFNIHPQKQEDVDKIVDDQAQGINETVRNSLKRKLSAYVAWKTATFEEIKNRRKFTIDYLRQHYHTIRMYTSWVKPYLKTIERAMGQQDMLENPRLVAAFESSLVEVEILARQRAKGTKAQNVCVLMTFEYHTKPQLQFQAEGYQRGPIHVGTTRITWRGYAWDDEQVKNYIAMKNRQDLDLLTNIDSSLKGAMDQLGGDIVNYLAEAESGPKKPEEKKPEYSSLLDPFTAVGKGFAEALKSIIPEMPKGKPAEKGKEDAPSGSAKTMCFVHYNIFKKAHGLLSW